jgi:hypothetical protein
MLDLTAWDCNQKGEKSWRRFVPVLGLRDEAVANLLFSEGLFPMSVQPSLISVSSLAEVDYRAVA